MKVNKTRKAISVARIVQSILSAIITFTLLLALSPIRTANAISGDLDGTFGAGGKTLTNIGTSTSDEGNAVALQNDGKIVVAGTSNDNFAVVRHNSDGTLDNSFGSGGKVVTDIGVRQH